MTEIQEVTEVDTATGATESHSAPLTAGDRCDSCGAQAYVRATLVYGELLFCLHHATINKEALAAKTIHWHDESERLLAR
jgi:hypothetical protein